MLPSEKIVKMGKPSYHYKTGTFIGIPITSVEYRSRLIPKVFRGSGLGWEIMYPKYSSFQGALAPTFNPIFQRVMRSLMNENAVHVDLS